MIARQWFNSPRKLDRIAEELVAGKWPGLLEMREIRGSLSQLDDVRLRGLTQIDRADQSPGLSLDDMLEAVFAIKGDVAKGKGQFLAHCAGCHRLGNDGFEVGPDLRSVSDRSSRGWLLSIMEPNRAVESKYLAYSVETESGDAYTGVVGEETGQSLTLRLPNSDPVTLRRAEITEIRGTELSLMPEGLDQQLGPQGISDLIAFLQQL